jgi:hypothetical protein
MLPATAKTVEKASFSISETGIGFLTFKWVLDRIDDYGRLEAVMSLQRHLPFLSSVWLYPIGLVLTILLLVISQKLHFSESLTATGIVAANGQPYVKLNWGWLWWTGGVVVLAAFSAALYAGVWLAHFEPPNPPMIVSRPNPPEGWDNPPKPSPPTQPPRQVIPKIITLGQFSPVTTGANSPITQLSIQM